MAAPNLKNPASVTAKANGYAVTTSMTAFLSNGASSNQAFKVNSVICCNVDGVNSADITLEWFDGATARRVAFTMPVPAKATQVLVTRDNFIYLEEGQSLRAQASASGDLELVFSYEVIA